MKYIKSYKESISRHSFDINEIRYLVKDALVDLIQDGLEVYVEGNPNIHNRFQVVINRKSKDVLFSLNDIKDSINRLISIMSSNYFEIFAASYYMNNSRPGFAKTLKWFDISMDPTSGEVLGDDIINLNKLDSDQKELSMFKMEFEEFNSSVEESDSWAGSLYAYDKFWKQSNRGETVELPSKQTTHYKCNDCGVEFRSFTGECINCKSNNVNELTQ